MGYQKKYKKFVATAATATLVASAIVPVASAKSFSDVAENNEFQPFIDALSDAGIINGYQDGTFKPGNKLTRGQVVKMLGRWVEANGQEIPADWNSVQRFNDVPTNSADQELVKYAALVKDAGVFTGSNGNLLANNNITRQQMAKVLNGAYTAINGTSLVELADSIDNKLVTDLASAQQEFEGYIQALVDLEISTVSVFRPTENVTRAQFAKFLYNTINLEVVEAEAVGVKAINATTVEVTFEDAVGTVTASDFTIEGLEVKTAVVKQSDAKTVVLTTSAQEAGKEYTVSYKGEEVGKFTGVSAVIPTAVDIVEKSQQGVLGEQITVKAKVTVATGDSAAGIPVTFNIVNAVYSSQNPGGALNQPIVAEATTDENGVATYTYTRYASTAQQLATQDEVQAYATGKPAARSFAKVYWAAIQPLTITEVTEGNSINNGAKKVYKVKVALEHAEFNGNVNGQPTYKVNVGFKENVNVAPDKAVKTVVVTDANGRNLGYPGQYTTTTTGNNSADKEIEILVDNKGEATFTVTGSNATVTPFVFVDQKNAAANAAGTVARFDETELVAYAPALTFGKIQNLGLNVTSNGTQNAAAYRTTAPHASNIASYATGQVLTKDQFAAANQNSGGRSYTAVLTDAKTGALAPSNTVVKVSLEIGTALSANDNDAIVYLIDENAKKVYKVKDEQIIDLYTDAKGQVAFKLVGAKDSYATPTLFSDTGDTLNKLDKNDLQQAGEIAYFGDVKVETAKLTVDDKDAQSANVTDKAVFKYQTVDQNGFAYYSHDFVATFQVDATFSSAKVTYRDVNGVTRTETVQHGGSSTRSFTVQAVNGVAQIEVEAVRGTRVDVSANAHNLPNLYASATFSSVANDGIAAGQVITGRVIAVDKVSKRILLTNSTGQTYELSYAGADLLTVATPNSVDTFEAALTVNDELQFTNTKEGTTSKFVNYNSNSAIDITNQAVSIVIKQDLAKYDSATSEANKGYDFGGETIGSAAKPATINITGNNTIIKNATIYGDIIVDVANDVSFEGVTHHGNVIVKNSDGDTINVTNNSSLDVVKLETKEHINLVNSSINEVVVATSNEINVTTSGTSSVGGYTAVGVNTTNIKQNGTVQTPVVEVPFNATVTTTTTTGDTISFTFSPAVTETVTLTVAGTVATLDTATASGTSKKFTFVVPASNAALVLTIGGKEYTATYTGLGTVTFTRKY